MNSRDTLVQLGRHLSHLLETGSAPGQLHIKDLLSSEIVAKVTRAHIAAPTPICLAPTHPAGWPCQSSVHTFRASHLSNCPNPCPQY